jgi:hypothetical protein
VHCRLHPEAIEQHEPGFSGSGIWLIVVCVSAMLAVHVVMLLMTVLMRIPVLMTTPGFMAVLLLGVLMVMVVAVLMPMVML